MKTSEILNVGAGFHPCPEKGKNCERNHFSSPNNNNNSNANISRRKYTSIDK